MKEIEVKVIKFQSNDGNIYDTRAMALIADDVHSGSKRWCPTCKGTGKVRYESEDGRSPMDGKEVKCNKCDGKKYQTLNWS